ncbi:4-amino-4-deoxychorismate lyase [Gemmobacter aquatilis]|uniref:Probable branched-chain-amino-acid aminotransferase n=1 Tax=Gemmobacter aquatilis TaxID=933059 RepID=A0A1H8DLM9_9RHOB|nr:4-amino-4-deoxychorismate lyase [Gemmobacter aquatilis]
MESALCGGAEPVRLIETLLWDGAGYPRLAGHLERLGRSAALLGFGCDPCVVRAALPVPQGAARVRLTLGEAGDVAVTVAALPAARAVWRLRLAEARLDSADPWLRVKSTRRASYDAARAALPDGVEEWLFLNERGEVCEGTITNLFFDAGQGLCTPPLSCGLLPGVLRAELIAQGCREAVLRGEDLGRVRLWVGNALRGRMAAVIT